MCLESLRQRSAVLTEITNLFCRRVLEPWERAIVHVEKHETYTDGKTLHTESPCPGQGSNPEPSGFSFIGRFGVHSTTVRQ